MVWRVTCFLSLLAITLAAQNTQSSESEQANPAAGSPESSSIVSCPAGGPLGAVELQVHSPRQGETPLPFRNINHLSEGDTLTYSPISRGKQKRQGEVALVMVPTKREKGQPPLIVSDPKPADKAQAWKMNETISLAALVYGPSGLSKKKVASFLSQDDLLVAQLADYADKTAQTEALVAALSNTESSSASVNAALNGFASQYGFAVQIDKNAPVTAQAQTLFSTMNPQLATYNPIGGGTAERAGQTASLATAAATLFFGNPVGLAAGGTAMLLDLRSIAFPDTQFRSSFAEPLTQPNSGLNLCGERGPIPPHTRVAYIWASRIPNAPTPKIQIGEASYLPEGLKSPVPVDVPGPAWKYLQRSREWTLDDGHGDKASVPVLKLSNQKALEIDLGRAKLPPGDYHLAGYWDWIQFHADGEIHIKPLSDFKQAQLKPASQDQLLAKAGKIPVTVQGADFEFTTKVEIKKIGDEFATPQPVRFVLPKGLREGPQPQMDVQVDTRDLDPGEYQMLIAQTDGISHPVNLRLLPNPPRVDNFPIVANQGIAVQHYVLKGERLNGLEKLTAPGVTIQLEPSTSGDTERPITVQFKAAIAPNTRLSITAYLPGRSEPLNFSDALQVTGPLPLIVSSKLSLPANMPIEIRANEFPAGYALTAVLDVKNIKSSSTVELSCTSDPSPVMTAHIGEQTAQWSLQQLSQDQLFLSFDTTSLRAGCALEAVLNSARDGQSQPFALARIIRIPQIDSFTLSQQPRNAGAETFVLTGGNLEMIEKTGWDGSMGTEVPGLPTPVPGSAQKQSLEINLPDPVTAQAPLYVWLRGDSEGRRTNVKCPALTLVTGPPPNAAASAGGLKPPQAQSTQPKPAVPPR